MMNDPWAKVLSKWNEKLQENADLLRQQLKDSVNEQGQLQHVIDLHGQEIVFLRQQLAEAQDVIADWKRMYDELFSASQELSDELTTALRKK